MDSAQLKDIICKELDDKKAVDITVLHVEKLTVLADYFIICTAKSNRQVKAIAENVELKLKEDFELRAAHSDGVADGKWAVLDYGNVILHVFNDETRLFYSLEKLWTDGSNIEIYKP